jgi:antitoxin YefM
VGRFPRGGSSPLGRIGSTVTTLSRRPLCRVRDLVHFGLVTKTIPVREFRSNLAELLSDVADRRDHVVVTRNGRPAAALVPIDEYQALEETAEILSDAATLDALQEGLDELARGETIELSDLRRDLAEKRAAR